MRCRYSSASGGYRLLVPSDRAVICSAKPLRSYLLADFIKRYINKLILLLLLLLIVGKRHNIWNGWLVIWWLIMCSLFKSFRRVPCAAWGGIIIQHFCINWYLTPNWTPIMIILNINWLCGGAWYLGQQFWTEHNSYCFGARRKDYFFILMDIL